MSTGQTFRAGTTICTLEIFRNGAAVLIGVGFSAEFRSTKPGRVTASVVRSAGSYEFPIEAK